MPNLKEVRTRIESVDSTQQITSAMKLVSASKLRRAQRAILRMRPYANKLHEILLNLSSSLDDLDDYKLTKVRDPEKILLVVISSNRGLCGPFNTHVIKLALRVINEEYRSQNESGNLQLMCLGKKAADYFQRRNYPVFEVNNTIYDSLTFENVILVADKLMESYSSKEFDRIALIYNKFKNAAVQIPTIESYLPVGIDDTDKAESATSADYIFEPKQQEIVKELIPKTLKIQLYKALLDSVASEHGARMTAMHKASDNAQEILKELKLSYNKARQAAITNEIIEIVSGANAL